MFEWLINRINDAMNNKSNPNRQVSADEKLRSIGVLDIFGFERFEENRFEDEETRFLFLLFFTFISIVL